MKIKVVGKSHLQGTSKKTNRPYNFIQLHYSGKAPNVVGNAALTLNLDVTQYPYDKIEVPDDYIVDFDGKGFALNFQPAPVSGK